MAEPSPKLRTPRAWLVPGGLALAVLLAAGGVTYLVQRGESHAEAAPAPRQLADIPFDGAKAYAYLKQLCALGPRPSGSPGMAAQQQLIEKHFAALKVPVIYQRFQAPHPIGGKPVAMANIIVRFHPQRKERVLLCTHYDTRPFPDLDPQNPRGTFLGANDGASGTALLMELGNEMADINTPYGVDFLFLDAEEFVFSEQHEYFLGSRYFAQQHVKERPAYRYHWGVLLDMIGDADLQIYKEQNSVRWRDTRPLVESLWATARRLGVREFIPQAKYEVRDDHLMLRGIAEIPTCNIIDFDYPHWHTQADTPERCSALSLAKVGWVVREWLAGLKLPPGKGG